MELFGVIAYTLLFLFIIKKWQFFNIPLINKNVLYLTFLLKIGFGFLVFAIYYYYYGNNRLTADAFHYYDDSLVLYNTLFNDPASFAAIFFGYGDWETLHPILNEMNFWIKPYNHGLFNDNQTLIRLLSVLNVFAFGYYHILMVFMCFISFVGLTLIFKTFYKFQPSFPVFPFIAIYLIPSVLFWASGVLKEGLLMFALGLFFCHTFKLMHEFNIRSTIIVFLATLLFFMLKVYVLVSILPGLFAYLVLHKTNNRFSGTKFTIMHVIIFALTLTVPQLFLKYDFIDIIIHKQKDFINVAHNQPTGSFFQPPQIDGTIINFISTAPQALINTLFRPFIWDSNTILKLASALENCIVFGMCLFAWLHFKKPNETRWNLALFFLSFTAILYLIIGWTTPVSGAIVRYKVPGLPFLLLANFLIMDTQKVAEKFPIIHKINRLLCSKPS